MENKSSTNIFSLSFVIAILATSLVSIFLRLSPLNPASIVVSLIGASAFICYVKQNTAYRLLSYIWIVSQLVTIETKKIITDLIFVYEGTIFDAIQTYYKMSFGLEYYLADDKMLAININVTAILLFILFRKNDFMLLQERLVQLEIKTEDSPNPTYLIGTTQKKFFNRMEKKWSWVKLQTPLLIADKSYLEVLIASKKKALLSPFKAPQMVYVKLPTNTLTTSTDPEVIESFDLLQNQDIDCEIKFL